MHNNIARRGLVPLAALALVSACGAADESTEMEAIDSLDESATASLTVEDAGEEVDATLRPQHRWDLPRRGGKGGSAFSIGCAGGEIAVGIYGRTGRYVDQIGLICAPLRVSGALGPHSTRGVAGGSGGTPFYSVCPGGTVLVGLQGRSGRLIDQIGAVCGGISGGVASYLVTHGGSGGGAWVDVCPGSYGITQLIGRSGRLVDAVQGLCTYIEP